MNAHTNPNDNNNLEQTNDEENCLQLSAKLDQAISALLTWPEFREITRQLGSDAATMAATRFLHAHRPDLFSPENPADGLASLYAGMN